MSRTRSWQEVAEVAAAEWTVREGAGTPTDTDDDDHGNYSVLDLGNVTTGRHSAHFVWGLLKSRKLDHIILRESKLAVCSTRKDIG